jgi:hypothetical protein
VDKGQKQFIEQEVETRVVLVVHLHRIEVVVEVVALVVDIVVAVAAVAVVVEEALVELEVVAVVDGVEAVEHRCEVLSIVDDFE